MLIDRLEECSSLAKEKAWYSAASIIAEIHRSGVTVDGGNLNRLNVLEADVRRHLPDLLVGLQMALERLKAFAGNGSDIQGEEIISLMTIAGTIELVTALLRSWDVSHDYCMNEGRCLISVFLSDLKDTAEWKRCRARVLRRWGLKIYLHILES
jgi:hypothetical protein